MILFLFLCSGATALVYEVVWSKYLSLLIGSTIQAQTIVLAVFMGGLALGNRWIGARSDLLRKPLTAYGGLEVLIGFYGFYFDSIHSLAQSVFVTVGTRLFGHAAALFLWKAVLSGSLLLLPTILMGGTLPLLASWLQKQSNDAGRWSARFYSINSLGAVCGAWIAGFWLIRSLGMASTLEMTAAVNLLVGFGAMLLDWRKSKRPEKDLPRSKTEQPAAQSERVSIGWLTILVAVTGAISMGLEVLASRFLALIFGASVQAFAIVLMAFILGIGLGSAAMASPRFKRLRTETWIPWLLLLAAVVVGVLVLGIEQWVDAYRHLRVGLSRTSMGYHFYQLLAGFFSVLLLGIPAGLIGAILPLAIRLSSSEGQDLGNRVGRLLTWNTLGAVAGVLFTGFVLMPWVGLRNAFNVLAAALCIPVLAQARMAKNRSFTLAPVLIIAGLLLSSLLGGEGWRYVLSSGVYRGRENYVDPRAMELRKHHVKLLFYKDGPDATVSVEEGDGTAGPVELSLRTNGKPEASSHSDMGTQLLVAHLPLLARPESKDVFVFGLASGITCGAVLAHPVEHLTVAENCRPMFQAAKLFTPWNRGVLTNRFTEIFWEDARAVLLLAPRQYDVIVSEPSNPWFASVGSIFSQEFYQLAASRLKPGGIMAQWFHVYEMNDAIVEMVLRTFSSVFPVMEVWDAGGGDLILLGSLQPWESSPKIWRKAFEREPVRGDLASIGFATPEALFARQFASQRTAFAIPGSGLVQSDTFPILEYDAPRAFFIGDTASRLTRFDERTWQCDFASPEKRAAAAALDSASLRDIFNQHFTINAELWQTLVLHNQGKPASSSVGPCLFFPTDGKSEDQFPPNASDELKRLLRARTALQRNETNWLAQIDIIRDTLLSPAANKLPKDSEESAERFAAAAARACLAHRQFERAKELLAIGVRADPQDIELAYLQRILERENPSAADPPAKAP